MAVLFFCFFLYVKKVLQKFSRPSGAIFKYNYNVNTVLSVEILAPQAKIFELFQGKSTIPFVFPSHRRKNKSGAQIFLTYSFLRILRT